jgi:hypothetical protein
MTDFPSSPETEHVDWSDEDYQRAKNCMLDILRRHAWTIGDRGGREQFDNAFQHAVGILSLTAKPGLAQTPGLQETIADRLVDWTYLHATEGVQWPSTKTKSMLISRAMQGEPTQDHADGMKAVASPDTSTLLTTKRCPTCDRSDVEFRLSQTRSDFRCCTDPWHGDDHLRAKSVAISSIEGNTK